MIVVIGVIHVAETGLLVPGFRHAAGGKLVLRRQHLADRSPADQPPCQIDDVREMPAHDLEIMQHGDHRAALAMPALHPRSEEHTSELQSLMRISYAVFCLKKKNTHTKQKQ